jgi:hypothetical protein
MQALRPLIISPTILVLQIQTFGDGQRTTMIYNNPRLEEMLGQMSAANRSKIVAKTSRAAIADRS